LAATRRGRKPLHVPNMRLSSKRMMEEKPNFDRPSL
jgi:hypothetical protein